MQNKITKILALIIKFSIIYFLAAFALSFYKKELPFYTQHILVWVLLYLPLFMGFESLIDVLFNTKKK